MRREVPIAMGFIVGTLMVLEYFVKIPVLNQSMETVRTWVTVIAAAALGLGAVNLALIHSRRIAGRTPNWAYSLVLLAGLSFMVIVGLSRGTNDPAYKFVFNSIYTGLSTAMFATLAFFIASSSVRSFKMRNWDAGVLLLAAAIVMIGRVPIGESISKLLPKAAAWLVDVPNGAGQRGIMISTGLAFIAICFRIITGYSRDHLGRGE